MSVRLREMAVYITLRFKNRLTMTHSLDTHHDDCSSLRLACSDTCPVGCLWWRRWVVCEFCVEELSSRLIWLSRRKVRSCNRTITHSVHRAQPVRVAPAQAVATLGRPPPRWWHPLQLLAVSSCETAKGLTHNGCPFGPAPDTGHTDARACCVPEGCYTTTLSDTSSHSSRLLGRLLTARLLRGLVCLDGAVDGLAHITESRINVAHKLGSAQAIGHDVVPAAVVANAVAARVGTWRDRPKASTLNDGSTHTLSGECIHGYTTLPRVAACMHAHLEGIAGERGCGDADVHHGRVGVICEHIGVLHAAPLCHVTQTVQVPDVCV